ncbi:hypothetical protein Tco_0133273 [Tanacetum coccineum]
MGIPNEHQLKFNSIKDAKSLLQAVEKSISQEDVNQKFLRSLSPEWNTHTIVWRNKPEIDTLSLDDLYNNMKNPEWNTHTIAFYHKKNPKRAIDTKWVFKNKKDERGFLVEELSKMRRKIQIRLDEEFAFKLQAKFDEQERIETKKADAEIAQESTELKSLMEVIPDEEEVAVDVIPLATKPPSIVNWKIHKEGKKSYYQIIRNDGSSKMYLVFSHMLKSFDKEYLETLYKLIKAKYGSTRPVEDLDLVLYGDLKTMFNPHVED